MNGSRLRAKILAGSAVLLIFTAACAKNNTGASSGSGGPSITIVSPADGASVTSPVKLVLSVTGATIGPVSSGNMHFHVYVSGAKVCPPLDYCVVTSTDASMAVPAGLHTIKVVLAQPNHDETSTTASVAVNVTGGALVPASPSPSGGGRYGGGGYG